MRRRRRRSRGRRGGSEKREAGAVERTEVHREVQTTGKAERNRERGGGADVE